MIYEAQVIMAVHLWVLCGVCPFIVWACSKALTDQAPWCTHAIMFAFKLHTRNNNLLILLYNVKSC